MATMQPETTTVNDDSVCPICFEKFTTPRYLPCSHSFCHSCLFSYIVSQCKPMEPRLGFHCPLCREYIPSDGDPGNPEGWAELFPSNELQKIVDQTDEIHCQPCLRENDKEKAANYCLSCKEYLCAQCTKYHRRSLASLNHTLMSTIEIKPKKTISIRFADNCPKHRHKKVKMFCHDDKQLCCELCINTDHITCERVNKLEDAVQFLKESGEIDLLLNEINTFKQKLMKAKTEGTINLSEIDITVDENIAKTEKEFLNLMQHFENLKKEYVEEVYSTLKKGRDKLQREIASLEDGIFYTEYLETGLKKTKKTTNNTEALMRFIIVKEKIKKAKLQPFRQLQVNILEEKATAWTSLLGFKEIAKIQLAVSSTRCSYLNIRTVKINEPEKHTLTGAYFVSGLCLSNGRFLAVNKTEAGMCLLFNRKCFLSDKNLTGMVTWIVEFTEPYDACLCEGEIFVTNWKSNTIDVISSKDFHKLRSISLRDNVYGIASWNGCLYVACTYHILKVDEMGQTLKEYNNGIRMPYNFHLVVTSTGIIVYSNSRTNRVKAMTDEGQNVWSYESDNLKNPLALDTDFNDNIYVAGNESRNIHVLSNSGELIRLIDNIPSPLSCNIDEEEGIIYVASGQSMYLYRM